ncbi:MAG: hypothetical protein WAX44_00510 [Minisyncoccia bacterium]
MSTKTIGSIVVVLIVVVAGYLFFGNKSTDDKVMESGEVMENKTLEVSTNTTGNTTESQMGKKMAFSDYMKGNGSYKCDVHQDFSGTDSHGIIYISGGMVRGDYETSIQGTTMQMTMVVKDGYSYTWNSMMPGSGFKSKITEGSNSTKQTPSNYSFDANQIGEYDCQSWTPESSKFSVPTNIKFQSVN